LFATDYFGLDTHLFVTVSRQGDSEETFSVFESSYQSNHSKAEAIQLSATSLRYELKVRNENWRIPFMVGFSDGWISETNLKEILQVDP